MAAFHWCDFCFWPPLNNWGEKSVGNKKKIKSQVYIEQFEA